MTFLRLILCSAVLAAPAFCADEPPPDDDFSGPANFDLVVRDLLVYLDKDRNSALDAAIKLGALGKRALPALTEVFQTNNAKNNELPAYFSAYAISRMKLAEAARVLVPLLSDEKAPLSLKELAVRSQGLPLLEEGLAILQKAAEIGSPELRRLSYAQVALFPAWWGRAEAFFMAGLSDSDDEVRTTSAKICYFAKSFFTAQNKLIQMLEDDACEQARIYAGLALIEMRAKAAVPAMVRLAKSPELTPQMQKVVLRALTILTQGTFKDTAAVAAWWTRAGEAEYAKLEPPRAAPAHPVATPAPTETRKLPAGEIIDALPANPDEPPHTERAASRRPEAAPSSPLRTDPAETAARFAARRAALQQAAAQDEESTGARRRRERAEAAKR